MSQSGQFRTGVIVQTLTTDDAVVVGPDATGNITVIGGNNIGTTGNAGANSITVNVNGTTANAVQIGNVGGSLTSLAVAADGEIIIGSTGADPVVGLPTDGTNITWTAGAGTLRADLTATVDVTLGGTGQITLTDGGVLLGSGAGAITPLAQATDGQLVIGSTGADPVLAVPTDGVDIAWTTGAGTLLAGLTTNTQQTAVQGWNGAIIETAAVTAASDGAVITFSVEQNGGGDLTVVFSTGYYAWDTTPAKTVALTAGTDAVPVLNYVYLLESTKVLTSSAVGWPATEHAPLATVLCQSAASFQPDGAYKLHAWTDHIISTTNQGHVSDLNFWIRHQHATYHSGIDQTLTITANGAATDNVIFTTLVGDALQLHLHTFPAFAGTPDIYTVNDSVSAYNKITDLNELLTDSAGGSLVGRYFSLVIFGVISEATGDCKLMVNLPGGSYNNANNLNEDTSNFANFSIPAEFIGASFLISQLNLRHQNAAGGTWTSIKEIDLRGLFPSLAAGGGVADNVEFMDNVFRVVDDGDPTKKMAFEVSGVTTGTTRTITMTDANLSLVSPSFTGSVTAGAGDITATAGNIVMTADTAADGSAGQLQINASRFLHKFGTNNTFCGISSGNLSLTIANATGNTGFGDSTLSSLTTGNINTAFGYLSLNANDVGTSNTAIGRRSLTACKGNNNTAIGSRSGQTITTGSNNCAFGLSALDVLTSTSNNVAIGTQSLVGLVTGSNNIALGNTSGNALTTNDSNNIIIGNAGSVGDNNIIRLGTNGVGAGQQDTTYIAGTVNCATGVTATTGDVTSTAGNIVMTDDTANDGSAGQFQINGARFIHKYGSSFNSFLGINAGNLTLSGIANTGIGSESLNALTSSVSNTAVGYKSLQEIQSGSGVNTAVGASSLGLCTTGAHNTGVGYVSLSRLTTSNFNTALGRSSLRYVVSGSDNIGIGYNSGSALTTNDSDNIIIGNIGSVGDNNKIIIGTDGSGTGQQNTCRIAGIRGVTTGTADAIAVLIASDHQLGTVSSSIRYKQNVNDMEDESSPVYDLRPVTFEYKSHSGIKQYGLIAEEVIEHLPRLVVNDKGGEPESVKYHELPAILLNEMKKLEKRVRELESDLNPKCCYCKKHV